MGSVSGRPAGRLPWAFASLLIARAIYAYNWYDVGPIQTGLARTFASPPGDLSFALWAFLFAVGAFQIPAGILSLRTSPRTVSLIGVLVLGAGATGSALVTNLWAFVTLRFVVGIGAALFFSPAMALLTEYYEGERRGLAFGVFNGAFSLGAALAVFLTPVLANHSGDSVALLVGGIAMLAIALENLWVLPPTVKSSEVSPGAEAISRTLRSPLLWILALSLLGFWAANFAVPQYIVSFAREVRGFTVAQSGGLDAIFVMTALLGSPLGGYLASRTHRARVLLAIGVVLVMLSILALPYLPDILLWGDALLFGVTSGYLFGVLYLIPTRYREFDRKTAALSIGLINGIQVIGGSFLVLSGGYVFFGSGNYTGLWGFFGLVCIAPLVLLLWVRRTEPGDQRFL